MKSTKDFLPAILLVCFLIISWQAIDRAGLVSSSILPAPTAITSVLYANRAELWSNSVQTILESLIGLLIAIVLGIFCGLIIFMSSKLRNATYPLLVMSQTIPLIALAPLLLVWFGFDILPKIIIVVLYCFFPIAVAVADGLASADQHLVDLLKSMQATKTQTLGYVQIPAALPSFFSGLKISSVYAVSGAIVGEYVGAYKGLGIYMQSAAHSDAINLVFASIIIIVVLSLFLLGCVLILEKLCMPWRKYYE